MKPQAPAPQPRTQPVCSPAACQIQLQPLNKHHRDAPCRLQATTTRMTYLKVLVRGCISQKVPGVALHKRKAGGRRKYPVRE